jgi:hypothetical protein
MQNYVSDTRKSEGTKVTPYTYLPAQKEGVISYNVRMRA